MIAIVNMIVIFNADPSRKVRQKPEYWVSQRKGVDRTEIELVSEQVFSPIRCTYAANLLLASTKVLCSMKYFLDFI
jgi:hypothetical protein